MFLSLSDKWFGNTVSSHSGVRGKAPATLQFKMFYRLTKLLLVSILVILHLFQWNFCGVSAIEDPTTEFLWGLDPHGIGEYDYLICIIKAELCKGSFVGQNSTELYKSFHASRQTSAKDQIICNGLCIGHTPLTHSYLIEHTDPQKYTNCDQPLCQTHTNRMYFIWSNTTLRLFHY